MLRSNSQKEPERKLPLTLKDYKHRTVSTKRSLKEERVVYGAFGEKVHKGKYFLTNFGK